MYPSMQSIRLVQEGAREVIESVFSRKLPYQGRKEQDGARWLDSNIYAICHYIPDGTKHPSEAFLS